MTQPTRQEIIAEIYRLADAKGINRAVLLETITKESGLNPAAVGDGGQSFGLPQLFMGGGLGNVYEQQYGKRPDDPGDWKTHLAFMTDQIVGGGKGLEPWHAWKGSPDAWRTGQMPTTSHAPGAPGRRDRGPSGAESMAQSQQPNMMDFFKQWQEENKPEQNLLGLFTNSMGWTQPGDPKTTVAGALFNSFKKKPTKLEEQVANLNHYAPTSDEDQFKKLHPEKKQQTVAGALLGRKPASAPAPTQQGPTLLSALVGAGKANPDVPKADLLKGLFGLFG